MNPIDFPNENISIIIPAAGIGERLGHGPKGLLQLNGKPLIHWLAKKCLKLTPNVIISAPAELLITFQNECPGCKIILGGRTRQESVELLVAQSNTEYVIIHDAARPFVSIDLLKNVASKVTEHNIVGAFLTPDIPVAEIKDGKVVRTFRKTEVGIFQSPQAFKTDILVRAIAYAKEHKINEQSTLQLIPHINQDIHVVEGEKQNIKITTSEDWAIAQLLKDCLI